MKKAFSLLALLLCFVAQSAVAQPVAKKTQGIAVSQEGVPILVQCSKADATNNVYEAVVGLVSGSTTSGLAVDAEYAGTVTIPATCEIEGYECTITGIGSYAFYNHPGVTEIYFESPQNIVSIGKYAFAGTNCAVQFVDLATTNVNSDEDYIFYQNPSIRNVVFPASQTLAIGKYMFRECKGLVSVDFSRCTNFKTNGFGTATGGAHLFRDCKSLKTVIFPPTLTLLPNYCFNSTGLEEITIPAHITTLGTYLFQGDSLLRKVTFEHADSTVELKNYCFDACVSLAQDGVLTIPAAIAKFATNCYRGIEFDKVYCYTKGVIAYGSTMFTTATRNAAKLYVPATEGHTLWQAYKAKSNWNDFKAIYEIADAPDGSLMVDSLPEQINYWYENRMASDNGFEEGRQATDFIAPATLAAITRMDVSNRDTKRTFELTDDDMVYVQKHFPGLRYLDASNYSISHIYNKLTTAAFDFPQLDTLRLDFDSICNYDLSKMPALKYFKRNASTGWVNNDPVYNIDVTKNTQLRHLEITPSTFTAIDLSNNNLLEKVILKRNNLTELDLSNKPNLTTVNVASVTTSTSNIANTSGTKMPLRVLNLAGSNNVDTIWAQYNMLEELDLTGKTKLKLLHIRNNELRTLKMPASAPDFKAIYASNNHLRAINLSGIGVDTAWTYQTTGPQNDVEVAKQLPNNKIGIYCPPEVIKENVYLVNVRGSVLKDIVGNDTTYHVEWAEVDGKNYLVVADGLYSREAWDGAQVFYTYYHMAPHTNDGTTGRLQVNITTLPDPDVTNLPVTVGEVGQEEGKFVTSLYYGSEPLKVPAGIEARTYKVAKGVLQVSKTYPEGATIPAGEAVLLFANDHQTYTFDFDNSGTLTPDPDNMLHGSDVEVIDNEEGYKYYILAYPATEQYPEGDVNGQLGFWWQVDQGVSVTSAPNKAYLKVPEAVAAGIKGFNFEGGATGITTINGNDNVNGKGNWYTLDGQRLNSQPTQKGIYINNGKKIVIK